MNAAASAVVSALPDICIAYGVSDEYSFVFHKSTRLFERRAAKLVSTVVSTFTAFYVHLWGKFIEGVELEAGCLPTFDGRAVCYPSVGNLRDYMRWRQVDCKSSVFGGRAYCSPSAGHINNLYNTTFWAMIQKGGLDSTAAEAELQGTVSSDKNEILFSRYGINYNNEPELFKKGSVVFREYELENTEKINGNESRDVKQNSELEPSTEVPEEAAVLSKTRAEKMRKARAKARVVVEHIDIHKDEFWAKRPWILSGGPGKPVVTEKP
jgi:tRNA(His) guanylyltransferase